MQEDSGETGNDEDVATVQAVDCLGRGNDRGMPERAGARPRPCPDLGGTRRPGATSRPAPAAVTSREGQLESMVRELQVLIKAGAEREARLERRLQRLEEMQTRSTSRPTPGTPSANPPEPPGPSVSTTLGPGPAGAEAGPRRLRHALRRGRGAQGRVRGGGAGTSTNPVLGGEAAYRGPFSRPPSGRYNIPTAPGRFDTETIFGSGFQIQSKDSEYQLQFHDLTQVEGRL